MNVSIKILLSLITMVIVFHFLIVLKVVPYDIAWGGRIQSDKEMYVFEAASIVINLFLGLMLLQKGNYIRLKVSERAVNIFLWIFVAIFILNTVGNLFAKTLFEKFFAVVTLLFASLIWKTLRKKETDARS